MSPEEPTGVALGGGWEAAAVRIGDTVRAGRAAGHPRCMRCFVTWSRSVSTLHPGFWG